MGEDDGSLLPGFGGLEGINEARNVQARDKATLELLLKLSDKIIAQRPEKLDEYIDRDFHNDLITYSLQMHAYVSQELKYILFTEEDIASFILSNLNLDNPTDESMALGVYTGALAQLLTERNARKGKRTRIYINAQGQKFDYLFLGAHMVDEIILHNAVGVHLCSDISSASKLIGIGLKGEFIFSDAGFVDANDKTNSTKVNEIFGIGINGGNNCDMLNNVERLIVLGIRGDHNIETNHLLGHLGTIVAIHAYGEEVLAAMPADDFILMGTNSLCDLYKDIEEPMRKGRETKRQMYFQDIPQTVSEQLHELIYGNFPEISQGLTQYSRQTPNESLNIRPINCFSADKLSAHLKDKPQDEILRIVDELTRYVNELSQRLLVR